MIKLKKTINYLRGKNKVLLLTTSNRSPKSKDIPKSTKLAQYIKNQLENFNVEVVILNIPDLNIYPCSGNVSESTGNVCGVKDALLKNKEKNPSGYHRCWVSWAHKDDELWKITKELFESDVVLFFGSVRWGQSNAFYQKLIERLNWIENRWSTLEEDNIISNIEAGIIFTGHNWNGENVIKTQKQVLKFYGFEVPDILSWNWQYTNDYLDESQQGYKEDPKLFEKIFDISLQIKEAFKYFLKKKCRNGIRQV
jgi:multimeric flavodoxin WrbA